METSDRGGSGEVRKLGDFMSSDGPRTGRVSTHRFTALASAVPVIAAQIVASPRVAGAMVVGPVVAAIAFGVLTADPVFAQTIVPGAAQPGRVDQPVRRPVTPLTDDADISEEDREEAVAPAESGITFVLKGISFEGATVLTEADFRPLYEEYLGTSIAVETVFEIAAKASSLYRERGYILSQVIVPPQEIDGGTVRLTAIEGFVDRVLVEGEVGRHAGGGGLVQATVEKIMYARPLNTRELERYLLLAGDLAGIAVRGVFTPSATTPGAATLTVKSVFDHFEGAVAFGNDGSDFVGPYLGSGEAIFNSTLGLHERIGIRAAGTPEFEELRFGEVFFSLPVSTEGTSVNGRISIAKSQPGESLKPLGFETESTRWSVDITHPFVRSRRHNLFGTVQFDWDDLEANADALGPISKDKLRVLRLKASGDRIDTVLGPSMPAVNSVAASLNFGLDAFGATNSTALRPSRRGADGQFTSLTVDAARLQQIHGGWTAYLAVQAQVADGRLLSSEQIGFGGRLFGRGYDPSAITGDNGVIGKAELQYQDGVDHLEWLLRYQAYLFADAGWVHTIDAAAFGQMSDEDLNSFGGGLRLDFASGLKTDFTLAWRTSDDQHADNIADDLSAYFRLVHEF